MSSTADIAKAAFWPMISGLSKRARVFTLIICQSHACCATQSKGSLAIQLVYTILAGAAELHDLR